MDLLGQLQRAPLPPQHTLHALDLTVLETPRFRVPMPEGPPSRRHAHPIERCVLAAEDATMGLSGIDPTFDDPQVRLQVCAAYGVGQWSEAAIEWMAERTAKLLDNGVAADRASALAQIGAWDRFVRPVVHRTCETCAHFTLLRLARGTCAVHEQITGVRSHCDAFTRALA